tara:strand:- start:7793 stop:8770 length:978 start_codon:yes stop_codon:yes gene_type:complete
MIDVVIPSMLGGKNLETLISDLIGQGFEKKRIFIIKDGLDPEWKNVSFDVNVVETKRRLGFAGACDFGIRNSNAKHVLLLNDDLTLSENFHSSLLKNMSYEPFLGFRVLNKSGKKIEFDGGGMNVFGYGLSLNFGKKVFHKENDKVLFSCGACSLLSKKHYEKIGGFSTAFFCYFEDVEFGWRGNRLGYNTLFIRDSFVRHVGQHTSGRETGFRERMMERNSFLSILINLPSNLLSRYLSLAWEFSKIRESESSRMKNLLIENGCLYSRKNFIHAIKDIEALRVFANPDSNSFKKTRNLLMDPLNPAFPKMISKNLLEKAYELWF